MKTLLRSFALALFVLTSALTVGVLVRPASAVAQDEEQQAEQTEQQVTPAVYSYTAQAGDSYTKVARKAVQTYGIIKQVNLSQAQIVAAETYLTQGAGSPRLKVGDKLEVKESDVEAAVKRAQALSQAQQALWQKYVARVDFNTNNVGEARS